MKKLSDEKLFEEFVGALTNLHLAGTDEDLMISCEAELLARLSDGRRAIEAMEKVFHGLIERHIEGECVNCDYILKICKDYAQAKETK